MTNEQCIEVLRIVKAGSMIALKPEILEDALSHALTILENLNKEKIEEILRELSCKQIEATHKAVNKKGLMNTDWGDIDKEGGYLDFKVIAQALIKGITE